MRRQNGAEVLKHPDFDKVIEENYDFIVNQSKKLASKLKEDPGDLLGFFALRLNKSLWSYKPDKKVEFSTYMCSNIIGYLSRDFFSKDFEWRSFQRYRHFTKKEEKKNLRTIPINDLPKNELDNLMKQGRNQKDPWLEEFDCYFNNRKDFWNQFIDLLNENEKIILQEYIKGTKVIDIGKKINKHKAGVCTIMRSIKNKIKKGIHDDYKLNKIREELLYV